MATMAVARSASGLNDVANHANYDGEARNGAESDLAARGEVDVVARALCAVSMHSSLSQALLSFYASLDPAEARERTSLVLDRMQKILPHDLAEDLPDLCRYERPWTNHSEEDTKDGRSLVFRYALPAVYLIGALMLALTVVGSITTVHYLLGR
ncbi:MAG TPA: hypothetical protein VH250_07695 [Granulicella sp.]|jgi:hypothetical protein|nr:hypothetical protein [Granulicella sp.]